jgi:cyclic beta-1,2-glucan synthetase
MRAPGGGIGDTLDLRQSSPWRWGISGDFPFILVEGDTGEGSAVLAELVRAQRWWNARGVKVDLVVTGHGVGEYQDLVRDRVRILLSEVGAEQALGRPGGIHVVRMEELGSEEQSRLRTLAAFRVDATGHALESQVAAARPTRVPLPKISRPTGEERTRLPAPEDEGVLPPPVELASRLDRLAAPSALGGFDPETGDYVIRLKPGEMTPAPWVNVIARDRIGFVVTESGGSFTWTEDAGEFRLTPWSNDPVLGLLGEILYLRDEDDGQVWTPGPGPLGRDRPHRVRHGWGRTTLSASSPGLNEDVTWFLHPTLPAKVVRLRLENREARPRRFSATFFVDWVLGPHPLATAGRIQVQFDSDRSAVVARNPYSLKFPERIAFLASDWPPDGMATDREEFLGSAGPLDGVPIGLRRILPGERSVPDGRPCGVLRKEIVLGPGGHAELSFFLGAVERLDQLDATLEGLRAERGGEDLADTAARKWKSYLGRVRVRTPDPVLDQIMNGWLPYQTLTARLRGRTGFYQSGGAFGFRDQLQDVYALLPLDPTLAAEHLEGAARRQFLEGDVLHWWHPGTLRGVRTRCSDDLLWLPWVLAQTVSWTGDSTLLERKVPYLSGPPLAPDARDHYDLFAASDVAESLWDHAVRAVTRVAQLRSPRGLPLMGTGDWNDGMDRVGEEGRGESVWLGWFFVDTCRLLAPIARARGDERTAMRLEEWTDQVRDSIEAHAWDGAWYRRAFFDDGRPLGSRESREARIDSIAQSWGVISGAADRGRSLVAMGSAWKELVREEDGVVLLLTPPFAGAGPDPGYIAAYPPGVRENGGQYTHAAAWLVRAFAKIGDGERAGALLRLLLPTRHAEGLDGTRRYRVEPYVIAADVYGAEPHVGRGGWTWYTGSAGWLWRVALEDVLGIRREGKTLSVDPCVPLGWGHFEVDLEVEGVPLAIRVRNPDRVSKGVRSCVAGGIEVDHRKIPIPVRVDQGTESDAQPFVIDVTLGKATP